MRKALRIFILVYLSLSLTSCTLTDSKATINDNHDQRESSVTLRQDMPLDTLAILYHDPETFVERNNGELIEVLLDDNENSWLLEIVSDNIDFEIWAVGFDNEKMVLTEDELLYTKDNCNKFTVFSIKAYYSEGIPNYKLKLIDNNGVTEYYIQSGDDFIDPVNKVYLKVNE